MTEGLVLGLYFHGKLPCQYLKTMRLSLHARTTYESQASSNLQDMCGLLDGVAGSVGKQLLHQS
jgi:hypothetical protein